MTSSAPKPPAPPPSPAPEGAASTVRSRDAQRRRSGRRSTILGGVQPDAGTEQTFLKTLLGG